MTGVWCCTEKTRCRWQGVRLHQGLAWGTVPPLADTWRQYHDRNCCGVLVQLIAPDRSPTTALEWMVEHDQKI